MVTVASLRPDTGTVQGTMQDYPLTLHHVFWRVERLFGHKQVVTLRGNGVHRYSYAEFARRVYRLANALKRLGLQPGDRVGTLAWNNYRHLELYFAVPLLGGVLHTLNLRLFSDQLAFVIHYAGDRFIFTDASLVPILNQLAGKLDGVEHLVVMADEDEAVPEHQLGDLADYERLLAAEADMCEWPEVDERAAAAMCYTSGTTGNPKGVVYTHRSQFLHTMGALQTNSIGLSEADVVLPAVPMFHANAWGMPYAAAMAGANLLMLDRWVGDSAKFVDMAFAEGATVLAGVPTIGLGLLTELRRSGRRLPSVRVMPMGGSAVPEALMRGLDEVGIPVLHAWGMTETSPLGTIARPASQHAMPEALFGARISQGLMQPGVELRLADLETGAELPWDGASIGEVQARGPWIAGDYHHHADPEKFTADGWLRTGDMGIMSADGYLTLVDRSKDVIKSGGEWISSVDLENAIMGHPQVAEAAVIGLPHSRWQERPVAYVVRRPETGADLSADDVKAFLRGRVATWWLPDEVRFVDVIPKTSVGKFDKKAIRAVAQPLAAAE